MNRGIAALITCSLLALPLSACGSDDPDPSGSGGDGGESAGPYAVTEEPRIDVDQIDPPADYNEIEGSGYTIAAPGEFQQQTSTSPNGEPRLVLEKPSAVPQVPHRVVVIRDVMPRQDAEEQSFALETIKSAVGGEDAPEVHRYQIEAPEGQSAFLITWVEPQAGSRGTSVDVTYWQLMYQTSEDLILNVVAFAPTAEFETSEVSRILRTFDASTSA